MSVVTLSQLESHLWKAAWLLKGPIDAADFKTYILPSSVPLVPGLNESEETNAEPELPTALKSCLASSQAMRERLMSLNFN